jgi:cyclic pyranopterin phosphate synthase
MDRKPGDSTNPLTHFDASGNARMVDVCAKETTMREALAAGEILLSEEAYRLVRAGDIGKGDVLGVARIAAIMAAKKVDSLIPLAHPLNIDNVLVDFSFDDARSSIEISATIRITGKTGVEMEALTAVSLAALTIYDMCKAVDKSMTITNIRLIKKTGGKSGFYERNE